MLEFVQNRWKLLLGLALGALVVLYLGLSLLIGHQVESTVARAREVAPGAPLAALLRVAQSTDQPLDQRNSAIWALGQLGDARALPVLEKLYTGGECDHQRALCQRGLRKAIEGCRGGTNISAVVWRHGDLASR